MNLRKLLRAAVLFGLALGVTSNATALAKKGGTDRPFKGTAEGVVTEMVTPAKWIIDYVGNATHLGKFTRREWVTFNGDGTFQGNIVFVAANGDELDLDFSGFFVSPNDAVGTYNFSGGSGRFADATGTADFWVSTPDFINVSVIFDGTISY